MPCVRGREKQGVPHTHTHTHASTHMFEERAGRSAVLELSQSGGMIILAHVTVVHTLYSRTHIGFLPRFCPVFFMSLADSPTWYHMSPMLRRETVQPVAAPPIPNAEMC